MSELESAELFNALGNGRRQHVIREVTTGPKSVSDLSESRAREEYDIPVGEPVPRQQRKRVYIGLYQTHLDQLDQLNIVDWDGSGDVTPGPNHDQALRALEFVSDNESEQSRVNTLLGLMGGVRG